MSGASAKDRSIRIEINQQELKSLLKVFNQAPRDIRGPIKKRLSARARKVVTIMKASQFSGPTGAHTLRHRGRKERSRVEGKPLKNTLAVKKVQFGKGGTFGGYIRIGFRDYLGRGKKYEHPLAAIYEFSKGADRHTESGASRGSLRTRAPLWSAWEAVGGSDAVGFYAAVSEGIDDWIKSKWRR